MNSDTEQVVQTLTTMSLAGFNVQKEELQSATVMAAKEGNVVCLKLCILAGGNVNWQDEDGCTATMWAAYNGRVDCLKLCIEVGGNVNDHAFNGMSATMWAAYHEHINCLKLCVEAGGDIYLQDEDGECALLHVAGSDNPELFRALIAMVGPVKPIRYRKDFDDEKVGNCLRNGVFFIQ